MPGGACCYYGVCCPPELQAVAMANALGIPLEAAQKIANGFLLIPRSIDASPAAKTRLASLEHFVKAELKAILAEAGHEVEEEGA